MDAEPLGKEVAAHLAAVGGWRRTTLERVRSVVHAALPGVEEAIMWRKPSNPDGVLTWSRGGLIATGESYKDKVKVTFAKGAALPDPNGLFNAGLGGSTRRAIDFAEGDAVDVAALKALVKASAKLNG